MKLHRWRWHELVRLIAGLLLLDQLLGAPSGAPSSEAIIVACIGALFAPVPTERRAEK
jgi:hypothetical protein